MSVSEIWVHILDYEDGNLAPWGVCSFKIEAGSPLPVGAYKNEEAAYSEARRRNESGVPFEGAKAAGQHEDAHAGRAAPTFGSPRAV